MTLQRIMLVDDDEISNFIYKRLFKLVSDKIEIMECTSAEGALHRLRKMDESELPQLIFLDVNLAGMNAWEFMNNLHKEKENKNLEGMKIYIASSTLDERDIMKAYKDEMVSGFLSKPVAFEKLKNVCTMYETAP